MKKLNIKKILVPFDFSNETINGFKAAENIANLYNAEIVLLCRITPLINDTTGIVLSCAMPFGDLASFESKLNTSLMRFVFDNAITPGSVSYKVVIDYWQTAILNETKKEDIDLIVIGHSKKLGVPFLGNNLYPYEIIKDTNIPVLSITKHYVDHHFKNLILPLRNVKNWRDKIPFIISLAQQTGALVHIIGLESSGDPSLKAMIHAKVDFATSIFKEHCVRTTAKSIFETPELKALFNICVQKKGDLIAITPDLDFKIRYLFNHRFYTKFIINSPAPVMGIKLT